MGAVASGPLVVGVAGCLLHTALWEGENIFSWVAQGTLVLLAVHVSELLLEVGLGDLSWRVLLELLGFSGRLIKAGFSCMVCLYLSLRKFSFQLKVLHYLVDWWPRFPRWLRFLGLGGWWSSGEVLWVKVHLRRVLVVVKSQRLWVKVRLRIWHESGLTLWVGPLRLEWGSLVFDSGVDIDVGWVVGDRPVWTDLTHGYADGLVVGLVRLHVTNLYLI